MHAGMTKIRNTQNINFTN